MGIHVQDSVQAYVMRRSSANVCKAWSTAVKGSVQRTLKTECAQAPT